MSLIAIATSPPSAHGYSSSSPGSLRWSMNRIRPSSIRKAVRKPRDSPGAGLSWGGAGWARAGEAATIGLIAGSGWLRPRAASGLSRTPAASAAARWRAPAAPAAVAAEWITSAANWRKKRRRPRSTSGPGTSAAGTTAAGTGAAGLAGGSSPAGDSSLVASFTVPGLVADDALDPDALEPVASLEELELDEEAQANDLALEPLDQVDRAADRAAGGEQIVDHQDPLAGLDRVAMDLERVRSIFERVLDGDRLGRQLAQLADRNEASVEQVGHRRAKDEAA